MPFIFGVILVVVSLVTVWGNFSTAARLVSLSLTVVGWTVFALAVMRDRRRNRSHERYARTYAARVHEWRACGSCGTLMNPGTDECPSCRWAYEAGGLSRAPHNRTLETLPRLHLRSRYRELALSKRAGWLAVEFMVVALIAWGLSFVIPFPGLLPPSVWAVISALGAVTITARYVLLGDEVSFRPDAIEVIRPLRNTLRTSEVDRIASFGSRGRRHYLICTRTGRTLTLGGGLSEENHAEATEWLRGLAQALRIPYWESLSTSQAIRLIARRPGQEFQLDFKVSTNERT